ncbi:hypothetical protein M8C21_006718 [Ambrosia artemisiifolia]|uniref:DUF4283 domain-containing protein n=1 Tax=Ambrosia artemisiifolia TaxID=4212 RepID=A0AAD5D6B8_AMBAR|nr:hypothetical protein M8C21_006718 [Ambrosia artemisiifolia]
MEPMDIFCKTKEDASLSKVINYSNMPSTVFALATIFCAESLHWLYKGLNVLLVFHSQATAENFLKNKFDLWSKWFTRLYLWEGTLPEFQRVAWIKVFGVPLPLWDRQVFNKIGERCGRVLSRSEAYASDDDLSADRMAILVHSGVRVADSFVLKWKDQRIKVWVQEMDEDWKPEFLYDGESSSEAPSSPIVKSKVVGGFSGDMEDSESECEKSPLGMEGTCMEGVHDFGASPNGNSVQGSRSGGPKENFDFSAGPTNFNMEDISSPLVEPINSNNQSLENSYGGLGYVTIRPKDKRKKKVCSQSFKTPDLNVAENSDPFNLEELIRRQSDGDDAQVAVDDRSLEEVEVIEPEGNEGGPVVDDGVEEFIVNEAVATKDFGVCLGIHLNGFENHLKKMVGGELATDDIRKWREEVKKAKFGELNALTKTLADLEKKAESVDLVIGERQLRAETRAKIDSLSPGCKEKLDLAGTGSFYNEIEADIVVQHVLSLIYAERGDVCSCGVRQVLSGSKSSVCVSNLESAFPKVLFASVAMKSTATNAKIGFLEGLE